MTHKIYPDVATATALGQPQGAPIRLAAGKAMSIFVQLADLAARDPPNGGPLTSYILVAMSGPQGIPPKIELLAHAPNPGAVAPTIDPRLNISSTTRVPLPDLRPDHEGLAAAHVHFIPTDNIPPGGPRYANNVYPIKIVRNFDDVQLWVRITNATNEARDFVWVVADRIDDARQPWIHVSPATVTVDAVVGERASAPILVANRGTGALKVSAIQPAIAGLAINLALDPAATMNLAVPVETTNPQTIDREQMLISSDPGPFQAEGHSNKFRLIANIRHAPPIFDSARPFAPERGPILDVETDAACEVTLFGKNFDVDPVTVTFEDVEASIVDHSANKIVVIVPPLELNAVALVPITVTTGGGSATTTTKFRAAPLPVLEDIDGDFNFRDDPSETRVEISGDHFTIENGDTVQMTCSLIAAFPESPNDATSFSFNVDQERTRSNRIIAHFPIVDRPFRFVGGEGTLTIHRTDGAVFVHTWEPKGF